MTTDRELLELAAKAAEIDGKYYKGILNDEWVEGIIYIREDRQQCVWNPLAYDVDALRLAGKLGLTLWFHKNTGFPVINKDKSAWETTEKSGPYPATRLAIVRAAAEIGRRHLRAQRTRTEHGIIPLQNQELQRAIDSVLAALEFIGTTHAQHTPLQAHLKVLLKEQEKRALS